MKKTNIKIPDAFKSKGSLYAVGIVAVLVLLYLISKRLGLIKSVTQKEITKTKQEQKLEKQQVITKINEIEAFDPNFLKKTGISKVFLDSSVAKNYAKKLYWAMWGIGTSESKINAVFRVLTHMSQLAQIATYYMSSYKKDLLSDLKSDLTKKELVAVLEIVKKLKY